MSKRIALCCAAALAATVHVSAQDSADSARPTTQVPVAEPVGGVSLQNVGPYRFEASATAGPAVSFFRDRASPISEGGWIAGLSTMFRLMWHPGRLLSVGFATGYTLFSHEDFNRLLPFLRDSIVPGRVAIYGVPLQFAVSMQKYGVELGVAMGPYIVFAELRDEDHTITSRYELGVTAFASYQWDIGNGFRAGPGIRCIVLAYRGIVSIVPEYGVRYDIITY